MSIKIKCQSCGFENDADARFCQGCGKPIAGTGYHEVSAEIRNLYPEQGKKDIGKGKKIAACSGIVLLFFSAIYLSFYFGLLPVGKDVSGFVGRDFNKLKMSHYISKADDEYGIGSYRVGNITFIDEDGNHVIDSSSYNQNGKYNLFGIMVGEALKDAKKKISSSFSELYTEADAGTGTVVYGSEQSQELLRIRYEKADVKDVAYIKSKDSYNQMRKEVYDSATALFNAGFYLDAKERFRGLGDYKDSPEYLKKIAVFEPFYNDFYTLQGRALRIVMRKYEIENSIQDAYILKNVTKSDEAEIDYVLSVQSLADGQIYPAKLYREIIGTEIITYLIFHSSIFVDKETYDGIKSSGLNRSE